MKIVCGCGMECAIHNPPVMFEITMAILRHATPGHNPKTVEVVCECGAARIVGPGLLPDPPTETDIIDRGKADGEWFKEHVSCNSCKGRSRPGLN